MTGLTEMRRWHLWASVPPLVVGVGALVRGYAVYSGDFTNTFGTTTDGWLASDSAQLWGLAWAVFGALCLALAIVPARRCVRITTAMLGVFVSMGWAWLIYTSRSDLGNATMWAFISIAVLIGFSWGMDPAPLERIRRRENEGDW